MTLKLGTRDSPLALDHASELVDSGRASQGGRSAKVVITRTIVDPITVRALVHAISAGRG